jgi:hypothetical protein
LEKPKEFGICYTRLQVFAHRYRLTGLIRPVRKYLLGSTCNESFGRLARRQNAAPGWRDLSPSDASSFFCFLLGILKNMSSLFSTDVKRRGGISFAEGADGVGGWVRRAGGAEVQWGCGRGRGCICLHLPCFLIQFLLFSVALRGLRLDCLALRGGVGPPRGGGAPLRL